MIDLNNVDIDRFSASKKGGEKTGLKKVENTDLPRFVGKQDGPDPAKKDPKGGKDEDR